MTILNPTGLWLLLGIPVLIIIYLIRVRHEDRPVSSTFIWKLSSRFMKKRLPVQRIKKLLTFLLQLLIIIAVALLAARPALISGPSYDYIAIIDGSASMQTTDETGKSRFDYALEEVDELAKKADRGHTVSVLLATDSPSWLVKKSTSKKEVRLALDDTGCTVGSCDIDQVLELAQQACMDSPNPQIIFYTDNTYEETTNIQVVNLNKNEWNISVEDLVSQAADLGMTFTGHITSYNRNMRVTVGLRVNGILEETQKVQCEKNTSTAVTFTAEEITKYETAEIFVEVEDSLPFDNSVTIFHRSDRTYNVTLVSQSPLYLGSALNALGSCKVSIATSLESAKLTGQDLYVFDGIAPKAYPTDGSVLVFGTQALPEGLTASDAITQDAALTADSQLDSPIFSGLSLSEAVIHRYAPLRGNLSWQNLFFCDGAPVISTKKMNGGTHFTVASFDVHNSNLPMLTDFLVLMDNLVEYSIPSFLEGREHIAGKPVTLTVTPSAQQLYVQYPDGATQELSTATDTVSVITDQVGIYTAVMTTKAGGEYADFFVRLSPEETASGSFPELSLELFLEETIQQEESLNEIWFWLALGLLLLILTEWGWYYREQY